MLLDKGRFTINGIRAFVEKHEQKFLNLDSLKYLNEHYKVNDFVVVGFENKLKNNFYKSHARIKQILYFHKKKQNLHLCFIRVEFFFGKDELPNNYLKYWEDISVNELFSSGLEDFVNITNLVGKFKLVNLEEYQNSVEDIDLKFCQASFDIKTGKITPKMSERDKICLCNKFENPDFDYIFCEDCKKWFHYFCAGLKETENISDIHFKCKSCR